MVKRIAKIANEQRSIGNLGNGKRIANLANGPTNRRPTARAARHGLLCRSDQSIVLFARSFLLLAFCWRSPPQGRRPGRSEPVGPQEIFLFLSATRFNSLIANLYTKVLECLTLGHLGKIVTCLKVSLLQRVKSKRQKRYWSAYTTLRS